MQSSTPQDTIHSRLVESFVSMGYSPDAAAQIATGRDCDSREAKKPKPAGDASYPVNLKEPKTLVESTGAGGLEESFKGLGLSEGAARIAAAGRETPCTRLTPCTNPREASSE
jgi:hypothetical protein